MESLTNAILSSTCAEQIEFLHCKRHISGGLEETNPREKCGGIEYSGDLGPGQTEQTELCRK